MGKLLYIIISIVILFLPVKDWSSYAYASKSNTRALTGVKFYVEETEDVSFSFVEVDENYFQWITALCLSALTEPLCGINYAELKRSLLINSLILFEADVSPPVLNV